MHWIVSEKETIFLTRPVTTMLFLEVSFRRKIPVDCTREEAHWAGSVIGTRPNRARFVRKIANRVDSSTVVSFVLQIIIIIGIVLGVRFPSKFWKMKDDSRKTKVL